MSDLLDIEPDEPSLEGVSDKSHLPTITANFLPNDFPLATLLRFMPDVKLKARVTAAADRALSIDVKADGGLAKADAARAALLDAIAAAEKPFDDPTSLANQLHKRLTGLRTDFTKYGKETADAIGRSIVVETKRRERLVEEQRQRDQEKADAEARAHAEQLAKDAAKRKAPKDVVENLKAAAKTAAAPPVQSSLPVPTLHSSTTVAKWKGRFVGTTDEQDANPDVADLSPAQQESARRFFAAIGDGSLPLALGAVNWPEINRKAHAERSTFVVAGMEAVDVGGLRPKGRR